MSTREEDTNEIDTDSNIETLNTDEENDELDTMLDVDMKSVPSIDELRNREDVTITELLDYIDRYEQKLEICEAKITKLKEAKRENVKKHRGSVIDLHNRMFKKLIETESEQKTELERAQDRIKELEMEIEKYKLEIQINKENKEMDNMNEDEAESFKSAQLQKYIDDNLKLEKELDELKKKQKGIESELSIEKMKHERTTDSHRKSISTLHTNMFKKLLDAEDDFEDKIDKLNEELAVRDRELTMERLKNEQSDKLRRDSIQTVHNNMLTKLLDAQAEHDEKEEKLQNEIKELKAQLRKQILQNEARSDKRAEAGDNDDDSDMSDLETEKETRDSKKKQPFDDLWDEADEPEAELDRLKAHIEKIERELKEEKEKNVYIEKQRKDSIHNLHNNMFQKLLDAEFEYEEEIERLHREKEELNEKIVFYEEAFEKMNKNGYNNDGDNGGLSGSGTGTGTGTGGQIINPTEVNTISDDNGGLSGSGTGTGTGTGGQIINPTEVIQLKEDLKIKNETIDENKQRIFHLTQKIEKLELQLENEQKQRRGSVSFLSKQMMAKLLEAEEENEEQKAKFKDKLQRLEKELEDSKENAFNLEKTRRNSVTKVSQTMFHKLLQAEQTKKQMIQEYEDKIQRLEQQLASQALETETAKSKIELNTMEASKYRTKAQELEMEVIEIKKDSEVKEKKRRESFSQLQNNYW
eukprot:CAMPEP_0201596914 /NCGR_PEP_ID=MMETSP0190_2-20130828/193507_1 /ASSEMBLY_ACC=CAM_ASM_000263 /TAXON_ID=37353 /ORGANISM="Rosalina sp." /LENGTH=696 /DNA_ID=CAMNT_0048057559 /DNA_START=35 /DNA_END=2121 /DNA_ORIENTATION=-